MNISNQFLKEAKPAPVVLALILAAATAHADGIPDDTCTNENIKPTTPSSDFTVVADGSIVLHNRTGLEWRRCQVGKNWEGSGCEHDSNIRMTWQESLQYADDTDGWRLPDIKELTSITELCRNDPAINQQVFPDTNPTVRFWSASVKADNTWQAWSVDFTWGADIPMFKSNELLIRLVRDAE